MSREGGRRGAVAASHRGCGSREPAKGGARRLRSAIAPAVMLRGGQVAPEAEAEAQTDVRRFEDTGDVGLYAGNLLPADPTKGGRSRRAIASGARLFGSVNQTGRHRRPSKSASRQRFICGKRSRNAAANCSLSPPNRRSWRQTGPRSYRDRAAGAATNRRDPGRADRAWPITRMATNTKRWISRR